MNSLHKASRGLDSFVSRGVKGPHVTIFYIKKSSRADREIAVGVLRARDIEMSAVQRLQPSGAEGRPGIILALRVPSTGIAFFKLSHGGWLCHDGAASQEKSHSEVC